MTAAENNAGSARWGKAEITLIAIAIVVRIIEYARNKAIWLDEAHLALSILRRSYGGLTERLDYGQGAPLAFLWAERFVVESMGTSEYALRLVPVLASIASCIVVYLFLSRFLSRNATLFSFAVFALSTPIIRYASEVKAYATDLLVAVVLYVLLIPRNGTRMTVARTILAILAGALAVWSAFPAIFVLIGIGSVLFVAALRARDGKQTAALATAGVAWLASFAINYQLMLRHNTENAEVRTWWLDRFMPLPPTSAADGAWFIRTYYELFAEPVGMSAAGVGAFLFVLGVHTLWNRNRMLLACVLAPIAVTLLVSGLQRYPFMGRFLIFLAPLVLIVAGAGWDAFRAQTRSTLVWVMLLIIIFAQPVTAVVRGIVKPPPEGVRPAFQYLSQHWRDADGLYVYPWAVAPFQYYEIAYGRDFPEIEGVSSRADWSHYIRELEAIDGNPRAWILIATTPAQLVGEEPKFFLTHLDSHGQRIDSMLFPESSVYLYNLQSAGNE